MKENEKISQRHSFSIDWMKWKWSIGGLIHIDSNSKPSASRHQTKPPKTWTYGWSAAHSLSSISQQRGDCGVALPLLEAFVQLDKERVALAVHVPL